MSSDDAVERRLMDLVRWQVAFGCRYPGSGAHGLFRSALAEEVASRAGDCTRQEFTVLLRGSRAECTNIIARLVRYR